MWRFFLLMACLSILPACDPSPQVSSQTENKVTPIDSPPAILKSQNYTRKRILKALNEYENADIYSGRKGSLAQQISMGGREDIIIADEGLRTSEYICDSISSNPDANALDIMIPVAENRSLIIINEDHSNPQHRAFILSLVEALKKKGFEHYAAETFGEGLFLSKQKYALESDGFYSSEPIFGRLISYAKSSGFELIKYEQTKEQSAPEDATIDEKIQTREQAQSDNLIAAVLGENPDAKIIVHVGHSHVAEIPIRDDRWMASFLKEKTGIDPLTISQTACQASGGTSVFAAERTSASGEANEGYTDYFVGHPKLSFTHNRPDWRRTMGDMDVAIPEELNSFDKNVVIEARLINHPDEAVPIDRIVLRPNDFEIPLLLPSGSYRIEAFDEAGRAGKAYRIDVPG